MSIQAPQGILNIPNATLRVGKLAVDSTAGFDTVFNNVERNTILLEDSTEYTDNEQWDLKMPNIFVATFEIKGTGSSFNFRNTSTGDAGVGYTLTFSGTTLTLKYGNGDLATATIPNLNSTYGKVYLTYEKQYFTVTVDGTRVLAYKDTGTRSFPDGEYINFFAGTDGGFKNLKVVAGHLISDGTSNIAYVGGGEVAVGKALAFNRVSNVSQIKVDSNVVTEYTGPHDRPLRKYPEVAMTQNDESATSGYVASASSTINNNGLVYLSFAGDGGTTSWTSQDFLFDTNDPYEALNTASLFDGQRGEWIQLQLPNAIKVSYFKIIPRSTAGGTNAAPEDQTKRGSLYGSNDGTNFTKLIDYGDLDYGGATGQNVQIIHVNATEHYKYLRLLCTARYGNFNNQQWIGVGELEYYGYEEGSGSIDTTLKSVYNVPATTGTQLEVYYDAKDLADGAVTSVTDLSPNSNDGSPTGVSVSNGAFVFDGSGDYLSSTVTTTTGAGNWPHSYSFWMKADTDASSSAHFVALGTEGGAGSGTSVIRFLGEYIIWYFWNNDVTFKASNLRGRWVHIVGTYDGGSVDTSRKIFINNVEAPISSSAGTIGSLNLTTTSTPFKVGSQLNNTNTFKGSIANVRLYSKALNADQVKELYDYQKDYFLGSKSQVTLYKGHLGVGVTEPSGQLELAGDERIQEYPPRGMTGFDTYIEGHGVFKAYGYKNSVNDYLNWKAFNKLYGSSTTDVGWYSGDNNEYTNGPYIGSTQLGPGTAKGDYLVLELPYPIILKKSEIYSQYNTTNNSPNTGVVYGKNTDEWVQVGSWSANTGDIDTPIRIEHTSNEYYTSYAIVGTSKGVTGGGGISIGEWRLFGTPGPTTLDKGSLSLTRSLDVPRVSRYDVDTETPRYEKLVVDFDTTVNSSPTDISGKGNHGTFGDSSGAPSYSPADKAFNFSGVNGVIYSGALSPAMTGDRICSMSCWFKTTDAANNNTQTLMWLGAYSGQEFIGLLIQNNQLKLTIGSDRAIETTSSPIQSNQWYHVVAIKSGTGQINSSTANGYFQIYINGEKSTDTTFQNQIGTLNITNNYLYIGAGGVSGQEPLNGYISNPKIYDVALEPSEVKKLYNLGRTGRSMVISDTAVGIGKVPEAQLDVRGSIKGINMTTCPVFFDATASATTVQNNNMNFDSVNASFGGGLVGTRFTAPIRGYYYFSIFFMGQYVSSGQLWASFMKNGSEEGLSVENARIYDNRATGDTQRHGQNSGSAIIFLNGTGDYVEILNKGGISIHGQYNRFQGFYLSG